MYGEREIYFKGLAQIIVGPGKVKLCRAADRPETQIRVNVHLESESYGAAGWNLQQGFYIVVLRRVSSSLGKPSFCS